MDIPYINDSLRGWVPRFAQDLQILLVDHDTGSLMKVATMLGKLSFKVSTAALAHEALSMIGDSKRAPFDVVMANVALMDMDIFKFIPVVLQLDIPVILMAAYTHVEIAQKAVSEGGATHFYEKPICLERLKYVWRYAYINRVNHPARSPSIGGENAEVNVQRGKAKVDEVVVQVSGTEKYSTSQLSGLGLGLGLGLGILGDRRKEGPVTLMPLFPEKRGRLPRPEWTRELHNKFKAALLELGEGASARAIQKKMNVPRLSRYQITAYRQRYNALKGKLIENGKSKTTTTFPITNSFRSRNESSTPTTPMPSPTPILTSFGAQDVVIGHTTPSASNPTIQNNSPIDCYCRCDVLQKLLEDDNDNDHDHVQDGIVDLKELEEYSKWLLKPGP